MVRIGLISAGHEQVQRHSSDGAAARLVAAADRQYLRPGAVQGLVKQNRLHTICEEGRCPNRGECYAAGTATFLLGGSICTRSCAFCQVEKGQAPMPVDGAEAERVADAVEAMQLRYVVLTAVARDDLLDHGASLFTTTMAAIRARNPLIAIEVLTPDFWVASAMSIRRWRCTGALVRGAGGGAGVLQPQSGNCAAAAGEVRRGPPMNALWGCWPPQGSWRHRFPPKVA